MQVKGWRTDWIAEGPVYKATWMATSNGMQCASPASRSRVSRSSDMACSTANGTDLSQLARPNALPGSLHLTMDRVQILVLPYIHVGKLAL